MGFTPGFGGELEHTVPTGKGSVPLGREPRTGSPRRCSSSVHMRLGHVQSRDTSWPAGYQAPRSEVRVTPCWWTWPNRPPEPEPGAGSPPAVGLGEIGAAGSDWGRRIVSEAHLHLPGQVRVAPARGLRQNRPRSRSGSPPSAVGAGLRSGSPPSRVGAGLRSGSPPPRWV